MSPLALAAALRLAPITCPHCGHIKLVAYKRAAHRTCTKCRRQFPDPLTSAEAGPKPGAE